MMQSILACFACGDKTPGNVVAPQNVQPSQIKVSKLAQSDVKTDDNKSRITMTTVTFLTSETPTKDEDDDQQIRRRIQVLKTKDLPERKAMQSQFVRQNLVRSSTIYLIDKRWSEQYTKFLKSQKVNSMPPIENEKLLNDKGELKINIKQKQDYFIVTQKIWKFVHGLYGGGPTISRDSNFPVLSINAKRVMLCPAAIQNPLNLCFMISILQMLLSVQQLNGYMLKKMYLQNSVGQKKKNFHNIFYRVIKQYNDTPTDPRLIQLKQFASFFQDRFNPRQQHDCHQFLLYFTELLQDQMRLDATSSLAKPNNTPEAIYSDYLRKHRSMIDKLFVGQMLTTVHCVSCDYKSKTFIPFLEVVLSISGYKNIQECLDHYFETEKLKDLYDCQNCKKKGKAIKSTCITKTPNYLIIVLGKFSCTTQKKIDDRIDYGLDLNIKRYSYGHCGDSNYILQSMIIHKGLKSNKGHYYTLSRRGTKNDWFYFNDGLVKQVEQKQILGRDPYILVYERVKSS